MSKREREGERGWGRDPIYSFYFDFDFDLMEERE